MQFLIAQWLHWLQLFFSRKAVADRLQYMCDRGVSGTLVGNKSVDHSDVVGASPVGAAPITSSFLN